MAFKQSFWVGQVLFPKPSFLFLNLRFGLIYTIVCEDHSALDHILHLKARRSSVQLPVRPGASSGFPPQSKSMFRQIGDSKLNQYH